ncbi:MAG: Smr/MutS family protein [Endomicrobia bacterium]|nr:Smr/MutS family protein [Bacillota bacterium]MCL1973019.1 Smr/MutS family protein [Endomicrobiia bacterium]
MSFEKLDLHPIFNKGGQIESELKRILNNAWAKKLDFIEIIPGKGSGQLKEKVLKFFNQKDIRQKYSRLDVDNKNFGRIFIYFNWNKLE